MRKGSKHDEVSILKMIKAHTGYKQTPEHIRKNSEGQKKYFETHDHHRKGKPHSEETKQKMSDVKKKYFSNPINRKKTSESNKKYYETHDSHMKGKHLSDETKQRLRESFKRTNINPTSIEQIMSGILISLGIYDAYPEYRVSKKNGRSFHADFFIPFNLIIECDGHHWHSLQRVIKRDKAFDQLLTSQGYTILRFTEKEIHTDFVGCRDRIREALHQ